MHTNTRVVGAATLACAAPPILADDLPTERAQFHKGASSATVEGTIKGYNGVDYVLGAKQVQSMNVSMATDNSSFQVLIQRVGEVL
mgnify:CR=1 FL=1